MFKDRGISFLGVNVHWDTEEAARMFVKARQVPYAVGHDTGNRIGGLYGVERTPTTFLVAQDGNVAAVAQGSMRLESLTAALEQLLNTNQ
jgi:peroxiredoxin